MHKSSASSALAVYVLNGSDAELSKHLGHRVRVTGMVIPNVPRNAQLQGPVGTQGGKPLKGEITRIKVPAVATIAASCSAR